MKKIFSAVLALTMPVLCNAQNVARADLVNAAALQFESGLVAAPSTTITFANDGGTFLLVRNVSNTLTNLRVVTQATEVNVQGFGRVSLTDTVVPVAAGARLMVGPFPTNRWNDGGGLVTAIVSFTSNISVSAVRGAQ